jgi:hypothetical protein
MKQHYIPKWLLKKWADEKGLLHIHRRTPRGMHTNLKDPAQVCYHEDGWTLDLPQPNADKYLIEKSITDGIDTKADKVFWKIERESISNLTADDVAAVTWLCSSILVRGPISIEMMKATAKEKFIDILASGDVPKELTALGTDVVEITHKHFPGLIENIGPFMIGALSFESKLVANILSKQWMLCDFSKTSVGSLVLPDIGLILSAAGPEVEDTIIALPISPFKALYFSSPENLAKLRAVGLGALALATIDSAVRGSRNFVIADKNANVNLLRRKMQVQP